MIQVNTNRVEFDREVAGLLARARQPTLVLLAMGRELGNRLKDHFRMKDRTEPNKLSARRQHFWLGLSRTVSVPELGENRSVSVKVSDARIAQKVFGGPIVAKRVKNLTVPVSERAYGRTAATFERETGLKLFVLGMGGTAKNGKQGLVLAAAVAGGVEVEYVLTPKVRQAADPTALPERKELERQLIERGQKVVDRELK